jgi:hypothetical protein
MKQYIAISFTLRGQDVDAILSAVEQVADQNPMAILISGFMPPDVVRAKNFDPKVADRLAELFGAKLDFYDRKSDAPLRDEMIKAASLVNAKLYILGKITDGVSLEYDMYRKVLPSENITLIDINNYLMDPTICRACRGDGRHLDGNGYLNTMCSVCGGSGRLKTQA